MKKKLVPIISARGQILALAGFILFLLASCSPELMKVIITKNGASVSTVMPYDQNYKRSLKDSACVAVEIIKNK